jgi:hypothetical protein
MLLPSGPPNTRCSVYRFEPGSLHVQLSPVPRTGLQSPETGSQNRRYRDGRRWLREIVDDANANIENIATRENCSVRQVNMTISLAFLAPDIVKAAIDGRLPRGIGVTRLRDAPIEWSRQHAMLGLPWDF